MTQLARTTRSNLLVTFAGVVLSLAAALASADPVGDVSGKRIFIRAGGHTMTIPYYRTRALGSPDANAVRAVIVIHGADRGAKGNFDGMTDAAAAAEAAGAGRTLVFAPHFLTEEDVDHHGLADDVLYWTSNGWKFGAASRSTAAHPRPESVTSYEIVDRIVRCLLDRGDYPALREIVIAGHSAGGQFSNRYAAVNTVEPEVDAAGLTMRYIVANPSTYVYFNDERLLAGTIDIFTVPSAGQQSACRDYNDYIYGLDHRYGYAAGVGADTIRRQYRDRTVSYLLGEHDNSGCAAALADSCGAELEGDNRLQRGLNYHRYLGHYYGGGVYARHTLETIPGAGHGSRGTWNSEAGQRHIFGVDPAALRAPTPLSPVGAELHTDFTWLAPYDAIWYRLRVTNAGGSVTSETLRASDAGCGHGGVCSYPLGARVLGGGDSGTWTIQAYASGYHWGTTSDPADFWEGIPDPPDQLIRPSGRVDEPFPTFEWKTVAGGAWYYLRVDDSTGRSRGRWYRSGDICSETSCCVVPDWQLPSGPATWSIFAWNHHGTSIRSADKSFKMP